MTLLAKLKILNVKSPIVPANDNRADRIDLSSKAWKKYGKDFLKIANTTGIPAQLLFSFAMQETGESLAAGSPVTSKDWTGKESNYCGSLQVNYLLFPYTLIAECENFNTLEKKFCADHFGEFGRLISICDTTNARKLIKEKPEAFPKRYITGLQTGIFAGAVTLTNLILNNQSIINGGNLRTDLLCLAYNQGSGDARFKKAATLTPEDAYLTENFSRRARAYTIAVCGKAGWIDTLKNNPQILRF